MAKALRAALPAYAEHKDAAGRHVGSVGRANKDHVVGVRELVRQHPRCALRVAGLTGGGGRGGRAPPRYPLDTARGGVTAALRSHSGDDARHSRALRRPIKERLAAQEVIADVLQRQQPAVLQKRLARTRAGNVRHCVNSAADEQVVDAVADVRPVGVQRNNGIPLRGPVTEGEEALEMHTQLLQHFTVKRLPQVRVSNVSLTAWKIESTMLHVVKA